MDSTGVLKSDLPAPLSSPLQLPFVPPASGQRLLLFTKNPTPQQCASQSAQRPLRTEFRP